MLEVRHSNNPDEIRALASQGFEPIECSIAGKSIVGPLSLDHHGELSHLEGVAVRAYRDHAGACAQDPRFVVTGRADEDATFAIAALAGWLPAQGLAELADLVNRLDTDPLNVDLTTEPWGSPVLLWSELVRPLPEEAESFVVGAALWRRIVEDPPTHLLEAALAGDRDRRDAARTAPVLMARGPVKVVRSKRWGFDVWYSRKGEADRAAGWRSPVVLAFDPERGAITVGCPSRAVAEELFGPGGLKTVFGRLEPAGWGGREAVGGSPRGLRLEESAALRAAEVLVALLRR